MSDVQERAREDPSSNHDTDSYGDDGIHEDREPWGYKAQTLK